MTRFSRPLLLALDLDGTVIAPRKPISARVVVAVRAAAAAGVPSTIVTGRMFAGARPHAEACGIAGPIICYQGAVIADVASGTFASEVPLANAVALRIYAAAKEHDLHVQFYRDDKFYVEHDNRFAELYAQTSGVPPHVVPSLPEAFAGQDSTKVNVVTDPSKTPEVLALMQRVCGDDAYVTRSNPEFVEMLSPRVNKGEALRQVAERLGVPIERVMAIGDSYNDLPLLQAAGIAVAMGSAPDELKAHADIVVADVEHDGVAEAIDRYVLAVAAA